MLFGGGGGTKGVGPAGAGAGVGADGVETRRRGRLAAAFFLPCGRELLGPASGLPKLALASWVATSSETPSDRATDLDRLLEELEEDAAMPPLTSDVGVPPANNRGT